MSFVERLQNKFAHVRRDPLFCLKFQLVNSFPEFSRSLYRRKCSSFTQDSFFILSFDCDTEKDIDVVSEVHKKLDKIGVNPAYAVPGELLEQGAGVYKALHKNGAEFLNHGYKSHTDFYPERNEYVSTLFYDELSANELKEDILRGHEAVIAVTGDAPVGFRTPHFGTFQRESDLSCLYKILSEMGYVYSSSTTPVTGIFEGPYFKSKTGIIEIPVSGCFDFPARIVDSWSFRFSPNRKYGPKDYVMQFRKMINFHAENGFGGVFNIYADPSQVYDWEDFFECIKYATTLKTANFSDLIEFISDE